MRERHGNGQAVIEILHLAALSGKLKMNVGDFRIKQGGGLNQWNE